MTETPWGRIKEICLTALELAPSDRGAYLDEACAGDPHLRREIDSLLAEEDGDFLARPMLSWLDGGVEEPSDTDHRIGAYRLVRPLGEGGMGEVFLAVQEGEGFERPVAVKLIRADVATKEVLDRFRQERRMLATLEHPNLARLIDGAATESGRPYLVMEFIDGVPITEYCDENELSIEDRLGLFLSVCDAVDHAHRNLIVHRDIKPSNILVTREGVPKLLDFGIGKALDGAQPGAEGLTRNAGRAMTPEYAAPEQVRGEPITTATDVHGLGVLLYELLTGTHPYRRGSSTVDQLERALLESTPASPSAAQQGSTGPQAGEDAARARGTTPGSLRRGLKGDLDNIVLKALRKEPMRRYASVQAMRDDVRRYLSGRPVLARPDSLRYRTGKLITRNPAGASAAALGVIALSLAIALPIREGRRIAAERDKAVEVQGFLLEAFGTTGGDESIQAGELLDLQASRVDSVYAEQPELRAQMLLVLADAYDRIGRYADAAPLALAALDIERELRSGPQPELATALNSAGWALHRAGESDEAVVYLEEALDMRRRLGRGARRELARTLNDLGVVRAELGDATAAVELHREALGIRRDVLGDTDRGTGVSASNLSAALYGVGDVEGAVREGELALSLLSRSVGADHQRTIVVQNNLAVFRLVSGDIEGAAAEYRDLLERQTRLQGADHPLTNRIRSGLANALRRLGRSEDAVPLLLEARTIARAQGRSGAAAEANATAELAAAFADLGRHDEIVAMVDEALPRLEQSSTRPRSVVDLLEWRARALARRGDFSAAADDLARGIALRDTMNYYPGPRHRYRLLLAERLREAGRSAEAASIIRALRTESESHESWSDEDRARLVELEASSGR